MKQAHCQRLYGHGSRAVLTRQFGDALLVGTLQTRDIWTDITARLEPRPLDFLQGFFVCGAC